MPGNMKAGNIQSANFARHPLLKKKIGGARFVLDVEPMLFKKRAIYKHRNRIRMKGHAAAVPPLDFCRIHHMVKMAVGEQQPIDLFSREVRVGAFRSVEKQVSRWGLEKVGICIQGTTSEFFERHDRNWGRIKNVQRFDCCGQLCKIY